MARKPEPAPAPAAAPAIAFQPIDALIPYARNARTHSAEQVAQIAASLVEFGWTNPVLADATGIVAGHGRVLAARQLYDAGKTIRLPSGAVIPPLHVPVVDVTGWSAAQRKAYVLADNQLALNAGWDAGLLKLEVLDLQGDGFDLSVMGFHKDVLADLLAQTTEGHTDPDDAPPLPERPVSELGDVWILGNHRIVCGDCTDPAVAGAAQAGRKPNLMVTDPPYGVEYDPSWRQKAGIGSAGAATGVVLNDDRADWKQAWDWFPGAVAYVWHGGLHAATVAESLINCRFKIRAQVIWVKTRLAIGRGDMHWQHEPAYYVEREDAEDDGWRYIPEHEVAAYAVKEGKVGAWRGGRKQSTVWYIEHLKSDTGHGTQKPVECMKRPIENNSAPGDAVYEPFSGSGTTIIACEISGRHACAVELNPAYVDVAVRRWEAFTKREAILEATGETFSTTQVQRRPPE